MVNVWAHGHNDPSTIKYSQQAWGLEISKLNSGEFWHDVASDNPRGVQMFSDRIDTADKGWRKRNNGHPILVLHCCSSSTFAQEISASKEFKNVIIIAPDATLQSTKKDGEWINTTAYGKNYKQRRKGLWHVYMNGRPLKDEKGKAIFYDSKAQLGTKGFNYRLNIKKQRKK